MSSEKYIKNIMADYIKNKGSIGGSPVESEVMRRQRAEMEHAADYADLLAVEKALSVLEQKSAVYKRVIELVYWERHWNSLERGDIGIRIHKAEIMIPASEPSIKRWLNEACKEFAIARGLRT